MKRRIVFDDDVVAERLDRALAAAKRGDCREALLHLHKVPDADLLNPAFSEWRDRVAVVFKRKCMSKPGLLGDTRTLTVAQDLSPIEARRLAKWWGSNGWDCDVTKFRGGKQHPTHKRRRAKVTCSR